MSKTVQIKKEPIILLAGNPNVGKSVIFNSLTGMDVTISNYPGTTVEITKGTLEHAKKKIIVIDLPGTYSLNSNSMDQLVARETILRFKDDGIIINIIDASNLERNLIFTLELLELGVPFIICLNMLDEAKKRGIKIDIEKLKDIFSVPVVSCIATQGQGIQKIVELSLKYYQNDLEIKPASFKFGKDVEEKIHRLEKAIIEKNLIEKLKFPPRFLAIKLIENDPLITETIKKLNTDILNLAKKISLDIEKEHAEKAHLRIAKERNAIAAEIANLIKTQTERKILLKDKIDKYTTWFYTGFPIMITVWAVIFSILVFGGGFLEELFVDFWEQFITTPLNNFLTGLNIDPLLQAGIINGLVSGIEATLAIVIPYVALFYIMLAILEDTGYLTRMAFLMDNIMHKIGLHGKSIIPLMAGFGCSVPAIMGTRILESKREKIIASFLVTLIPCSARTSVILGVIGANIGLISVMGIYLFIIVLIVISGYFLNKILKGEKTGLIIEMPPYRRPKLKNTFKKTWVRLKDFIVIAIPLIVIGSIVLEVLSYTGILGLISDAMAPLTTGMLGLPAVTGIVLFFGVLRKELAVIMLFQVLGTYDLLSVMTTTNLIVFTIVLAIYIPCIATFIAIKHELGLKYAALISISTIILAFTIGGITNLILTTL
ncbi:MAG: ferrous iron transport protein B [Candidatus Odinarchaeia archaeon]